MIKTLFALLASVETFDKWAERVFQSYRAWRAEQRRLELEEGAKNAVKKGSVSELRKRIRKEMGVKE